MSDVGDPMWDLLVLKLSINKSGYTLNTWSYSIAGPNPEKQNRDLDFEACASNVQSQSLELQRSFYNALLDVLWSFGLRERAARVLAEGRSLGVFDKDLLAEGAAFELDVWRIDLHDNSVGGGVVLLFVWLQELVRVWEVSGILNMVGARCTLFLQLQIYYVICSLLFVWS